MYIYSPNIDIFITYIRMTQGGRGGKRGRKRNGRERGESGKRERGKREGGRRERKGEGEKERHR